MKTLKNEPRNETNETVIPGKFNFAGGSGYRAPKRKKGSIYADNIGFRAPIDTRKKLDWLVRLYSYSANRLVIEAVDCIYDQVLAPSGLSPLLVGKGRDLAKYAPQPPFPYRRDNMNHSNNSGDQPQG